MAVHTHPSVPCPICGFGRDVKSFDQFVFENYGTPKQLEISGMTGDEGLGNPDETHMATVRLGDSDDNLATVTFKGEERTISRDDFEDDVLPDDESDPRFGKVLWGRILDVAQEMGADTAYSEGEGREVAPEDMDSGLDENLNDEP